MLQTLHITVKNDMTDNGTSIHWHGIRQLNSMEMDGVNGVTQCPIAPGEEFTYVFNATQYGSSWYHSHYSVQYADGLQGPLTIHGPSSANYDEPKFPLIMTDWGHNSAFAAIYHQGSDPLGKPSVLLNGTGNVTRFSGNAPTTTMPKTFEMSFDRPTPFGPRRYLLRLINTAFETTFTFSIDNHRLQIIAADFVPIVPYFTHSVTVAIGQRYNIIVYADQWDVGDGNFWIRTAMAQGCPPPDVLPGSIQGYERTGIVRYNPSSTADPSSLPWPEYIKTCEDEPAASLVPVVPWNIGAAANGGGDGEEFGISFRTGVNDFPVKLFDFKPELANEDYYFQINYSDPIFLDLERTDPFPEQWVVVPETFTSKDWVYLVLSGNLHPVSQHYLVNDQDRELINTRSISTVTTSQSCKRQPSPTSQAPSR